MWAFIIGAFIIAIGISLIVAHFKTDNHASLIDLVSRNGKLSTTMILQLVGGAVGTWVVVKMTATGTLTWDMFAIYLTYVASVDGFSKAMASRIQKAPEDVPTIPKE
jgi:hypothetical protein